MRERQREMEPPISIGPCPITRAVRGVESVRGAARTGIQTALGPSRRLMGDVTVHEQRVDERERMSGADQEINKENVGPASGPATAHSPFPSALGRRMVSGDAGRCPLRTITLN